ncbi:MAG: UDP-N-acetylglucosamine 2-epimerase (non-hydrolyzing) [Arenimonas sp.]
MPEYRGPARPTRAPIAILAGTRPECLKLVSLVQALRQGERPLVLIGSGQHPAMIRQTLAHWDLVPDLELPPPPAPGSLSATVRWLRDQARTAIDTLGASALVVQGDTSSAYAGALAAKAAGVCLLHVEAGLRTSDPLRPFPEEVFRRRIARLADWHFAPTAGAAANLYAEGIARERVQVSGNTGVDALRLALSDDLPCDQIAWEERFPRLLVLTLHRRENYGPRLEHVCDAVLELLALQPELGVVCPMHPNPSIGARMRRLLGAHPRIWLTEPLAYRPFVRLLAQASLVITDSGGIQEEAPYLGVPVVVARENTERPEALACGATRLVSADRQTILAAALELLAAPRPAVVPFTPSAPFGDGLAGKRIAAHITALLAIAPAQAQAVDAAIATTPT